MTEAMDTEMEFSDGEQSNANTHVAVSQYAALPPVYNRTALTPVFGNPAFGLQQRIYDHEQPLPGYVFMCNGKTKTDCYRYRVFGIPKGRKETVESIKPGMKLFLYDFEKRLLYGVYEATIGGKLDIQPEAFDRMYPAQVGFRIVRNCYPLPENTFKSAIFENYRGSKFKQELSPHQVMSLLSLFRPFSAPELDSLSHRLASRASAPKTLSFEERFIAATQLRNASSVSDPLSGRQLGSLIAHQSVPRTSLLQHSYSSQEDYKNPLREPISLSKLNQPYHPTEPRQQRLVGDSSRPSIQDPQLKYLTILSNIRRYGSAPEPLATENEYHPVTAAEKDPFTSPYSENKYYPSALSGNEHSSAASTASGSVYRSEFYNTSASQKEGEASQQHEIPGGTFSHPEASTVPNTTVAMQQSDMHAISVAQSHTERAGYPTLAHGASPQPVAGAIGYTHQPQSVANNYTTQSQPVSVEESTQSHAGTVSYTQQQYYVAMGHTTQLYAGGTEYIQQPSDEAAYAQQSHAAAYAQQSNAAAAAAYAQQPNAAAAAAYAQQSNAAAAAAYAQHPHAATAAAYAQHPHAAAAAAAAYAQQPHAAAAYAQQSNAAAAAYAQQPHAQAGYAQAVGYMPQYHTQAAGYPQQAVAQGSAPGTTDWLAASQAYSATRDWNAMNQSYYAHTTDAKTTYNQTS